MRWKSLISAWIAAAGMAAFSHCQAQTNSNAIGTSPPHQQGRVEADDPMDRLGQELKLSDAQKNKVQNVFHETRQKIQSAVQEAMTNADNELQRILTPEQYQKLQSLEHPRERAKDHSAPSEGGSTGKAPKPGK
ncbi:MAG: hypothetical protein ACREIC_24215 [Limisphaerales bacterium]